MTVLAILFISIILAGFPYKWTGKIAFVFDVITASILDGLMQKVSSSTSTNTGFKPNKAITSVVAIYVNEGVITSSPGSKPIISCITTNEVTPVSIGKSVKYDIQSEASHKFERFVDPACHDRVIRRFINIVSEHANIKDISAISYEFKQKKVIKIPVNVNKINQIIGTNISQK